MCFKSFDFNFLNWAAQNTLAILANTSSACLRLLTVLRRVGGFVMNSKSSRPDGVAIQANLFPIQAEPCSTQADPFPTQAIPFPTQADQSLIQADPSSTQADPSLMKADPSPTRRGCVLDKENS